RPAFQRLRRPGRDWLGVALLAGPQGRLVHRHLPPGCGADPARLYPAPADDDRGRASGPRGPAGPLGIPAKLRGWLRRLPPKLRGRLTRLSPRYARVAGAQSNVTRPQATPGGAHAEPR